MPSPDNVSGISSYPKDFKIAHTDAAYSRYAMSLIATEMDERTANNTLAFLLITRDEFIDCGKICAHSMAVGDQGKLVISGSAMCSNLWPYSPVKMHL
jgi:hypothetical protein